MTEIRYRPTHSARVRLGMLLHLRRPRPRHPVVHDREVHRCGGGLHDRGPRRSRNSGMTRSQMRLRCLGRALLDVDRLDFLVLGLPMTVGLVWATFTLNDPRATLLLALPTFFTSACVVAGVASVRQAYLRERAQERADTALGTLYNGPDGWAITVQADGRIEFADHDPLEEYVAERRVTHVGSAPQTESDQRREPWFQVEFERANNATPAYPKAPAWSSPARPSRRTRGPIFRSAPTQRAPRRPTVASQQTEKAQKDHLNPDGPCPEDECLMCLRETNADLVRQVRELRADRDEWRQGWFDVNEELARATWKPAPMSEVVRDD